MTILASYLNMFFFNFKVSSFLEKIKVNVLFYDTCNFFFRSLSIFAYITTSMSLMRDNPSFFRRKSMSTMLCIFHVHFLPTFTIRDIYTIELSVNKYQMTILTIVVKEKYGIIEEKNYISILSRQ